MTDKELEKIYNEGYRAVYWTAMSLLKNEADAEDVVQDTFIALIESYDTIKDKSKVMSWLKRTAANKSLNRITLSKTDNADDEFFDEIEAVPEDFLPDSIVESQEARGIVMDIIENALSEDIRRTLILFYFDEMSIKDISEALKVSQGTISWRLNFARKKIKEEVEKYEEKNKTRLFSMALPFLSKLFEKEAEQVAFKAMPAKVAALSASTQTLNGAGAKIAVKTAKKGTELMLKKVIAGCVAGVVVTGAATTGIIIAVKNSDEKPETTVETALPGESGEGNGIGSGSGEPAASDASAEVTESSEVTSETTIDLGTCEIEDGLATPEIIAWRVYELNEWLGPAFQCVFSNPNDVAISVTCDVVLYKDGNEVFRIEDVNEECIAPGQAGSAGEITEDAGLYEGDVDEARLVNMKVTTSQYTPINATITYDKTQYSLRYFNYEFDGEPTNVEVYFVTYNDTNGNGKLDQGEAVSFCLWDELPESGLYYPLEAQFRHDSYAVYCNAYC